MVTIKDVAKKAGVSISTASYAINNDPRISKETKEKILEVAKKLNYHPYAAARNLKRKRTNNIGVFVDGFTGPVYPRIIEGIHAGSRRNNFNIIVSTGQSAKALLLERQVDGAVVIDRGLDDETLVHVAKHGVPIIVLDRDISGKNIFTSMINNEEVSYELIVSMIKKGYRKIGYVAGPVTSYDNLHRFKGFIKALTEYNLPTTYYYKGDFTKASGYRIGKEIIESSNDLPDFLFCANDEMAIGVLDSFRELNIKVPDDIAIAGFDNIELSMYCTPKLTTVAIDHIKWGEELAQALVDILVNNATTINVNTKGKIIYRESC
ncbi:MAG: LacI family transcriptional regulator [Bacilli bacterium]|nr:LacI family transcriptional regulator [Bacilli bacterium]